MRDPNNLIVVISTAVFAGSVAALDRPTDRSATRLDSALARIPMPSLDGEPTLDLLNYMVERLRCHRWSIRPYGRASTR